MIFFYVLLEFLISLRESSQNNGYSQFKVKSCVPYTMFIKKFTFFADYQLIINQVIIHGLINHFLPYFRLRKKYLKRLWSDTNANHSNILWLWPKIQSFGINVCTTLGDTLDETVPNNVVILYFCVFNENTVSKKDNYLLKIF